MTQNIEPAPVKKSKLIPIAHDAIISASFKQRSLATLIDILVIIILSYLTQVLNFNSFLGLEKLCGLYYLISLIGCETTLGGKLLRIYTISKNAEQLTILKALAKTFIINIFLLLSMVIYYSYLPVSQEIVIYPALIIGIIVYLIVFSSSFFNKDKKSLIDFLSGTRVVLKLKTTNNLPKNKSRRKISAVVIVVILSFVLYREFLYAPKMYMYGNPYLRGWDKVQVEIPQEIVKSKDCEAFKKYADEKMGPDFVFSAGCPWAKLEPVGHFILNGITFNVPRNYLWQGSRAPDGLSEGLYLMFKYPSFEASSASGDQAMNIKVTIIPETNEIYNFKDKVLVDGNQIWYLITSGIEYRLDEFLENKDISEYIQDVPEMAIKGYINKYGDIRTYFSGDIIKPDYWIECDLETMRGNPRCESGFMYKGNNKIRYTFNRIDLILHHKEIRKSIEEKLDEFTK